MWDVMTASLTGWGGQARNNGWEEERGSSRAGVKDSITGIGRGGGEQVKEFARVEAHNNEHTDIV